MSDISKLVHQCFQVLLLVFLMTGLVFVTIKPDEKHLYQASLLKARLLANLPAPRLILFGGSNIAFGIDSEQMERELKIPVINDGLHVGLGVAPLSEIKRYIQSGDIIIISLEYYNFTDETSFYGQPQYLADWIEISPARIWDIQDPIPQIPGLYTIMLQRKINRQVQNYLYGPSLNVTRGFYTGDQFNEHGDFVGHLGENNNTYFEVDNSIYPVNSVESAYTFLESFHQFALSKGAKVFYEAQAHRQTNCDLTGIKTINRFFSRLRSKTTIPLLTNLDHLCLPDNYFYDTPYHLNERGREIRTQRLIESLRSALGTQ
ncbi:MAG TPA: hypothetical protein VJ821_13425 [Anaerolineales bacterium]|nr:hypothetical protein [Anaerolineales bacterium]